MLIDEHTLQLRTNLHKSTEAYKEVNKKYEDLQKELLKSQDSSGVFRQQSCGTQGLGLITNMEASKIEVSKGSRVRFYQIDLMREDGTELSHTFELNQG